MLFEVCVSVKLSLAAPALAGAWFPSVVYDDVVSVIKSEVFC